MNTSPLLWQLADRTLDLGERVLVMGILNVTPDSFSDGGSWMLPEQAVAWGLRLAADGADILDIGGESSRPGAAPIPLEEELRRVVPVVEGLARQTSALLSVDTTKAEVARQALAAGAHIINDITALGGDPDMPSVVRSAGAGVILMHMQGTPATMQAAPHYDDVTAEVAAFLQSRLQALSRLGIAEAQCVLDPGIGFGKTVEHSLQLLRELPLLSQPGRPVCLGISRKAILGKVLGRDLSQRLPGSLAAVAHALGRKAAQIFRVHDVGPTRDVVRWFEAMEGS